MLVLAITIGTAAIGWGELIATAATLTGLVLAYDKHTREIEEEKKADRKELLDEIEKLGEDLDKNKEAIAHLKGAIAKLRSDLSNHKELGHKHCPLPRE